MAVVLPFLSMCPKIAKDKDRLVGRTSFVGLLISLGCVYRRVVVEPRQKRIVIHRRLFWFFTKRRVIPFQRIASIVYSYEDWSPDTSLGWMGNTMDQFTVGLKLADGDEVHLFHFAGEGSFVNNSPLPDWLFWPNYAFDVAGSQVGESRAFAVLPTKMTGASLSS